MTLANAIRFKERFRKSNRLCSKKQFKHIFSSGKKLNYQSLLAIVTHTSANPNTQSNAKLAKLGIIIPKSVVPLAVHRNQCRRIIRESFRRHCHRLFNHELIVILRSKDAINDKRAFRSVVDALWEKIATTRGLGTMGAHKIY